MAAVQLEMVADIVSVEVSVAAARYFAESEEVCNSIDFFVRNIQKETLGVSHVDLRILNRYLEFLTEAD